MENLTLISLFIIGLSYGATACMFSCMPFLAPLLISNNTTFKQSSGVIIPFSLGRIFSYTIIAFLAFSSSVFVKEILKDTTLFQIVLGVVTIIMGLVVLKKVFFPKTSCNMHTSYMPKSAFGYFTMGVLVSLNPCAPILTLIGLSATANSFIDAFFYGISFGLGAVAIPFIFYGFIISTVFRGLIEQFRTYKKHIEIFAASILIAVGSLVLAGKVSY